MARTLTEQTRDDAWSDGSEIAAVARLNALRRTNYLRMMDTYVTLFDDLPHPTRDFITGLRRAVIWNTVSTKQWGAIAGFARYRQFKDNDGHTWRKGRIIDTDLAQLELDWEQDRKIPSRL